MVQRMIDIQSCQNVITWCTVPTLRDRCEGSVSSEETGQLRFFADHNFIVQKIQNFFKIILAQIPQSHEMKS